MTEKSTVIVRDSSHGAIFEVRVQPRAKRTAVLGVLEGRLKIALTAPPVDGRANEYLIEFLAEIFGVPRSSVRLLGGERSRNKRVEIAHRSAAQLSALIAPQLAE